MQDVSKQVFPGISGVIRKKVTEKEASFKTSSDEFPLKTSKICDLDPLRDYMASMWKQGRFLGSVCMCDVVSSKSFEHVGGERSLDYTPT